MKKKCLWSIMLLFCAILYSCNQEEIVENELPDFPQPTKSRVELRTGQIEVGNITLSADSIITLCDDESNSIVKSATRSSNIYAGNKNGIELSLKIQIGSRLMLGKTDAQKRQRLAKMLAQASQYRVIRGVVTDDDGFVQYVPLNATMTIPCTITDKDFNINGPLRKTIDILFRIFRVPANKDCIEVRMQCRLIRDLREFTIICTQIASGKYIYD